MMPITNIDLLKHLPDSHQLPSDHERTASRMHRQSVRTGQAKALSGIHSLALHVFQWGQRKGAGQRGQRLHSKPEAT